MRLENKSMTETKNILGEDMLPLNDIAETPAELDRQRGAELRLVLDYMEGRR